MKCPVCEESDLVMTERQGVEIDYCPACTVVFEMEEDEPDTMKRPPRRLSEPLFGREMILTGLTQGLGVLAAVLAVYSYMLLQGRGEGEARMTAFACLVIANLGLIFTNRSRALPLSAILRIPNKALWWITGGALGFLALVAAIPLLRDVFRFAPLHGGDLVLIVLAFLVSLMISESVKTKPLRRWIIRANGANPETSTHAFAKRGRTTICY